MYGGSAPSATSEVLDLQSKTLDEDKQWLSNTHQKLENANTLLMNEIKDIL
ncbi:MAG: hypothetical protein HOK23_03865 [Euryarchaeota archaeon]|nr:hypothetical protein [Euryarchaeota archaeon]